MSTPGRDEVVERVAQAICDEDYGIWRYDAGKYLGLAKAALEAAGIPQT